VLGSIIQNGPAFDLSAYNAQGGVLATYADLSAALTALNALPADFKKGGMSIKFVLSSDNKYVQYTLTKSSWSININDWEKYANQNDIDTIESVIGIIDMTEKGEVINDCLMTVTGKWLGSGKSYLIPKDDYVAYWGSLKIIPGDRAACIAFLKSDARQTGQEADFCSGYRVTEITDETVLQLPDDCNYIYVYDYYGTSMIYTPKLVLLMKEDSSDIDKLEKIEKNVAFLKGEFSKTIFRSLIEDIDLTQYPINGNIIIIGDSTVADWVSVPVSSYLTVTGTKTDISTPADTISGQLSKYNNLEQSVKENANYVFVQIGLNDNAPSRIDKTILLNYQSLIKSIRVNSPNAKIILGVMLPCKQRFYNLYTEEEAEIAYNNYLELNSAIYNLLFIGNSICASYHYEVMADELGNLFSLYDSGDAIHPTAIGKKVIAWSWLTALYR
jgi:hypothetical protein